MTTLTANFVFTLPVIEMMFVTSQDTHVGKYVKLSAVQDICVAMSNFSILPETFDSARNHDGVWYVKIDEAQHFIERSRNVVEQS